ncbi:MAG: glycosyltransferase family 4 protein [Candidatus Hodarchaeota archaeon]
MQKPDIGLKIKFIHQAIGMFRGGGEHWALNIACGLKDLNCDVNFLTGRPLIGKIRYQLEKFETEYVTIPYLRDFAQRVSNKGNSIKFISSKKRQDFLKRSFNFLGNLIHQYYDNMSQDLVYNYLKKHSKDFDAVLLHSMPGLGSRMVDELNIPTVIMLPGPPNEKYKNEISRFNAVISIGQAIDSISKIRPDAVNILPGVDIDLFKPIESNIREIYNIDQNDKVLIFVGRFVPIKNLPFLIDAINQVVTIDNKIKLLFVGEGPLEEYLKMKVNQYGINQNVIFTGKIEYNDLAKYYSAADIFVITSTYDNYPLVVLEAMSCQLPVIGANVGGIPQQIQHGFNGLLFEKNNQQQLEEAILTLINDKQRCIQMGKINRKKVLQGFSWQERAKKVKQIFENIII